MAWAVDEVGGVDAVLELMADCFMESGAPERRTQNRPFQHATVIYTRHTAWLVRQHRFGASIKARCATVFLPAGNACFALWLSGELVHLEDLVLHDAEMDLRGPTHELTRAHATPARCSAPAGRVEACNGAFSD
jgi:hypothetical protein